MRKGFLQISLIVVALFTCFGTKAAPNDSDSITRPFAVNSFWSNWYVQAGLNMSLQNPCNHPFSQTFTKGRTYGINLALGKEFSPEVGGRFKIDWNNGLFTNKKLEWMGPVGPNNTNHRDGGWGTVTADLLFDLTTIIDGYNPERRWRIAAFPRMGAVYNFALDTGSPLIGAGVLANFRLSPRWSLYADVAYHLMSSGIYMDSTMDTGTGVKGNGFFDISLGVQFDLDAKPFRRIPVNGEAPYGTVNTWKEGWYLQTGFDLTFQNPYGRNFLKHPLQAMTFGLDVAVGKWIAPGYGFRVKGSWGNGLIKNPDLEWLAPFGKNGINHRKGGWGYIAGDVQLRLSQIALGYDPERRWNLSIYPRMGLVSNFAISSLSPLIGAGMVNTLRLNHKYSLFIDMAYNVTTSEFTDNTTWSHGGKHGSSNGFFDFNLGLQIALP